MYSKTSIGFLGTSACFVMPFLGLWLGTVVGGLTGNVPVAGGLGGAVGLTALFFIIGKLHGSTWHEGQLISCQEAAKKMMGPNCWAPDRSSAKLIIVSRSRETVTLDLRGTFAKDTIRMNPEGAKWTG